MFSAGPYDLPLKVVYRWAKGEHTSRAGAILRCMIDQYEGWGEVAFGPHVEINGAELALELLALTKGLNPEDDDFLVQLDQREMHNRMRCAIATAWLSARAAAAGKPLNQYMADDGEGDDVTPPMQVPINGLVGEQDIGAAVTQAKGYAKQGMTTLKIKCFADVDHDFARVSALREAFPDFAFRLDPNDAWKTVPDALANMERFAPLGIDYIEDPLDTGIATIEDMAAVRKSGAIRSAWDNPVETLEDMHRLVDAEAVDVFIYKMPRAGGPDRLKEMVEFATSAGIQSVNTGPLETAIGTVAGLHMTTLFPAPLAHSGFSLSGHYARDLADVPPVVDGVRTLPDLPGLSIAPDAAYQQNMIS